jgi:fructose/tagatose bisphosphate aldolase
MIICETVEQLAKEWEGILEVAAGDVKVQNDTKLQGSLIDTLIYTAVFSSDAASAEVARWAIRRAGAALGIISTSIQPLYEAMGRKEVSGMTVPAINIRGLTYESAQAAFRAALKDNVGAVLFEIARSEIGYTMQRPVEYAASVTAAAIKSGYRGPMFLQGDHFQLNAKRLAAPDGFKEMKAVKDLIWEAIEAGFYNIDIDTSTLVDLTKPTVKEQQYANYSNAAELTTVIRDLEPEGVTVSVGGEIGEVGGKNSTVEELEAFMEGYLEELKKHDPASKGISKISVQTGTTHGGVPLSDGTVAKVNLDFGTLERLSREAKEKYGMAGAVQHGASTLPAEAFDKFPAIETAEIHLATGFQNIIFDSKKFPATFREKIYANLREKHAADGKPGDTDEQFIYKTRKKALGDFKRELWHLPQETLKALGAELEAQFSFLFKKLNMAGTVETVNRYVKPLDVPVKAPASLKA